MPYQKGDRRETTRLTLPSDPAYWVEMKLRPSYGDKTAAQSAMLNITHIQDPSKLSKIKRSKLVVDPASGQGVLNEFETQAYFTKLIERLTVDWNVDDLDGKVLPISVDTINELEPEDGDFLLQEAQKRLKGRPKEEEGPFERPSLLPSQEAEDSPTTAKQLGS